MWPRPLGMSRLESKLRQRSTYVVAVTGRYSIELVCKRCTIELPENIEGNETVLDMFKAEPQKLIPLSCKHAHRDKKNFPYATLPQLTASFSGDDSHERW